MAPMTTNDTFLGHPDPDPTTNVSGYVTPPSAAFVINSDVPMATNDTFLGHPDAQAVWGNLGHSVNPTYEPEQRMARNAVLAEFVDPTYGDILEVPPDVDMSGVVIQDDNIDHPNAVQDPNQPTPHRSTLMRRRKRHRKNVNDDSFLVETAGEVFGRKGRKLFKKLKRNPDLVDKILDDLESNYFGDEDEDTEVTPIVGLANMMESDLSQEQWNKVLTLLKHNHLSNW